ncbi:MAG: tetratricopeptide repeat protein [Phycisphaerales bacterium]|nr:MAG: tetratricopeptide repeat protein [Phycisphaerales bacterium]
MSQWTTLKERFAGRWQIPLLVVALILLAGALLKLRPSVNERPLEEGLELLSTMVTGGLFDEAIEVGEVLLSKEGPSEAEFAPAHLHLARARYSDACVRKLRTAGLGAQIVEDYRLALKYGQSLTVADYEGMGAAYEWQRRSQAALACYDQAVELGSSRRSDLRKRMIVLRQGMPDTSAALLDQMLDTLLSEVEDHRLDLRLWAIEQKLDTFEVLGRLDEATTLMVADRERFKGSDLREDFGYLEALLLYKTGHYDEAEAYLRSVRNQLDRHDDVYAKTGWLLGRVVMSDGGPQRPLEALSFFTDVVTYNPDSPYSLASRVGMAEALGMLERFEEAIDAYNLAIEELETLVDNQLINRDVLRTSLGVMASTQYQSGNLAAALEYARLAAQFLDPTQTEQATLFLQQLAQIQSARAAELRAQATQAAEAGEPTVDALLAEARALYAEGAATFVELARINTPDERRASESSWRASELYARAGELEHAVRLYRSFVAERPADPLVPRALLRVGLLQQRLGGIKEAIGAFQECYRRFPRTLDGARALTPLAQCYLTLGPGEVELAEKTLRIVLEESDVFTPDAPEFRDALFLLGDVLSRRDLFEEAIAVMEEAIDRYPEDARVWRVRYLLADSYRKSALALKEEMAEATFGGELEQMQAESFARFRKSRELYRQLITEYELNSPTDLDRLERLYLRHAYLYEADCFFETRSYREALRLYEDAAGILKDTPSGLAAYVQIINCHFFLGEPNEARAALARARILADAVPQTAFDASVSVETREDWKRYFEWLGESELF